MSGLDEMIDKSADGLEYKIIGIASELLDQERISEEEHDQIKSLAKDGEYPKAIDLIEEVFVEEEESEGLNFDDEEKDLFAEAFEEAIENLQSSIQEFRQDLQALENGISRGDMRQYLYGGKSSRTYDEVDDLFDAIDSVSAGDLSDHKIAKLLSSYTSELNISEVRVSL